MSSMLTVGVAYANKPAAQAPAHRLEPQTLASITVNPRAQLQRERAKLKELEGKRMWPDGEQRYVDQALWVRRLERMHNW
jgi:hypothetical protein